MEALVFTNDTQLIRSSNGIKVRTMDAIGFNIDTPYVLQMISKEEQWKLLALPMIPYTFFKWYSIQKMDAICFTIDNPYVLQMVLK